MNRIVFDISMSLDGFITAANQTAEEPVGAGGERLHEWAFGRDETNREYLESAHQRSRCGDRRPRDL